MSNRDEELARIHRYVLENTRFFCDPHPHGLGWKRPGGIPEFYYEHPDEWELDLKRVEELKEAERLRNIASRRDDLSVSRGMADETREILDSIRRMRAEGMNPAAIATQLDVKERAVVHVLAMGGRAYDTTAAGPTPPPTVNAFTRNWGRNWTGGGKP